MFGAAASYVGLVHGTEFKLGAAVGPAIGYLLIAMLCGVFAYLARQATRSESGKR